MVSMTTQISKLPNIIKMVVKINQHWVAIGVQMVVAMKVHLGLLTLFRNKNMMNILEVYSYLAIFRNLRLKGCDWCKMILSTYLNYIR